MDEVGKYLTTSPIILKENNSYKRDISYVKL